MKEAFTLVEILIVIAVIGVTLGVVINYSQGFLNSAFELKEFAGYLDSQVNELEYYLVRLYNHLANFSKEGLSVTTDEVQGKVLLNGTEVPAEIKVIRQNGKISIEEVFNGENYLLMPQMRNIDINFSYYESGNLKAIKVKIIKRVEIGNETREYPEIIFVPVD